MLQAHQLFPILPKSLTAEVPLVKLSYRDDPSKVLDTRVNPNATAKHWLQAELGCFHKLEDIEWLLVDGVTGLPIEADTWVAGLYLLLAKGRAVLPVDQSTTNLEGDAKPDFVGAVQPEVERAPIVNELKPESPGTRFVDATGSDQQHATLVLPPSHLSELVPPPVTDIKVCGAFRKQQVHVQDRLDGLYTHGHAMGDDELLWHLHSVCSEDSQTAVLDPLLALGWRQHPLSSQASQWLSDGLVRCLPYASSAFVADRIYQALGLAL